MVDWGSPPDSLAEGDHSRMPAVFEEVGFAEVAWLPRAEAAEMVGAIRQLGQEVAGRVSAPCLEGFADLLAAALASVPGDERVGVGKHFALDVVAEVLEIAERLHAAGRYAAAFGFEGVGGRLIEALIAAERPRRPCHRRRRFD